MAKLRGEEGCPWDKEQNLESLKKYLIEETYEVIEAIEENDMNSLKIELGDLLLQIIFQSQIAEEEDEFSFLDVVMNLNNKLVRRHP
ncbi:MAG: MazG nucleotide pyrophosphohydrolase domain-containing protein, partial [Bacillota bacterium]